MKARQDIADFDSASARLRALGRFLRGQDFPMLGVPSLAKKALLLINKMPDPLRKRAYIAGGWLEAIPPEKIGAVNTEAISKWVVEHYPDRRYPAIMVGSSNGAATHLCCALGIPWLPQTFLALANRRAKPRE